jgi:hypothetical protein
MSTNGNNPDGASTKEFTLADVMAGIQALQAANTAVVGRLDKLEHFNAELETVLGEGDDDEEDGDDPGELGEEGQPGVPANFSSAADAVHYLEARLNQIEDAKERAANERAFDALENRMGELVELNQELAAQNAVMAEAIHLLQSHGNVVQFSAGTEGGYQVAVQKTPTGKQPRSEFEARQFELMADGKSESEAIMLAIKEDKERYHKHLAAIGIRSL